MSYFIAIEGVIGVGKTTLARLLSPYFDEADVLLEVFEENPFLADFYGDRDRYAFQTQLFFLLSRYQQQKQAIPTALAKGNLISDYTFAKDELFAWLNLKDDELAMYGRVHSALAEKICRPDLLVYLKADHEAIMKRIALRDRPYERDMDPAYIRQLAQAYEAWLANLHDMCVLTIDVTALDFLTRPHDLDHVVAQIKAVLGEVPSSGDTAVQNDDDPTRFLPAHGTLSNYQAFHTHLDRLEEVDPDLFYNYMLMSAEMGAVASELSHTWLTVQTHMRDGQYKWHEREEALTAALRQQRPQLRRELADLLAYTLKLANYADIDLESAYLEKMREDMRR